MRDDVVRPTAAKAGVTMPAVIVALLALASVLAIAAYQGNTVTTSSPLVQSYAKSTFEYMFGPHLIVIALIATGFRRTGDVAAVAAGCWIGTWSAAMTMLTLDLSVGLVVLLQVMMVIAALVDLRPRRDLSLLALPAPARLIGLLVPVVVAFLAYRMIEEPVSREAARRAALTPQQRASEVGYVLEPSPLLPDSERLRDSQWADYSVLQRLMGMRVCVELFRGDSGGPYPRSLHELQGWSLRDTLSSRGCASKLTWSTRDTSLAFLAPSDGRLIRYTPPNGAVDPYRPAAYSLESEAVWDSAQASRVRGRPGVRNYLLDSAGNVHVTDKHRRVTMRDPVLPPCNPPEEMREVAECAVKYPARRRWGALMLPFAHLSMVDHASVGDRFAPMIQFHPVIAPDSVARVTIDWGDAAPGTVEEVPPISERSYGQFHDWNRTVSHVYRAPGHYPLSVAIMTRGGETFTTRESVDVSAR